LASYEDQRFNPFHLKFISTGCKSVEAKSRINNSWHKTCRSLAASTTMKKHLLFLLLFFTSLFVRAQFPTILSTSIIPASPTPTDIVKIVTHVSTPNQGTIVDLIHSVSHNPKEINLRPCYWQGMATAIQNHIDTFLVGQLQAGVYIINHKAFMSTTQQHCTKVDSNMVISTITVGGLTTGLQQAEPDDLSIFPNPVNDQLYFKSPKTFSEAEIYHLDGRLVCLIKPDEQGALNVSSLSKGIYFILISDDLNISRLKFIKD
jgi:hypothetical protein